MSYGIPIVRLVLGLTVAVGAQKLFGALGGSGRRGTARGLDRLAYRAPLLMGLRAGLAEFGGGLLAAFLVRSAGRHRKPSAKSPVHS